MENNNIIVSYDGYKWVANHPSSIDAARKREFIVIYTCKKIADKNKTFIDVGACAGMYTVRLAKHYRKIVAIEPNQENIKILRENLKLNNINNVEILPYACGESEYVATMENRAAQSRITDEPKSKTFKVHVKRLDNIVEKADVIKIDVEGYEKQVIDGASKIIEEQTPFLIVEHHDFWKMNYPKTFSYIFNKLSKLYYICNLNQVHWLYIPRTENLKKFRKQLTIHFFYKAIENIREGKEWYYGMPERWWHGMSLLEFYYELPNHVLKEQWIKKILDTKVLKCNK